MKIFLKRLAVLMMWVMMSPVQTFASQIVPMTFEEMTAQAERVIVGVCTGKEKKEMTVENDKKSNLAYTEYMFEVSDVIKGNVEKVLKIRQVNLGGHGGPDSVPQMDPLPLPDYEIGQEVILFLAGESTLGLTSPVGMDQAVFDVKTEGDHKVVTRRFDRRKVSDEYLEKWKLLDDTVQQDMATDLNRMQRGGKTERSLSSHEKFISGIKKMVERQKYK